MKEQNSTPSNNDLLAHLRSTQLSRNLDEVFLENLSGDLNAVTLKKEKILFHQGDLIDAMYIVIKGHLQASIHRDDGCEMVVGEIGEGELVGEMQILSGGKRTATVCAMSDTELVKLPRDAFQKHVHADPEAMEQLNQYIRKRIRRNLLASVLPKLFGPLDEKSFQDIENNIEWVHLHRGEILLRQGDPGDSMYIVISGRLRPVIEVEDGTEKVVGEIARGECIGEMALFTGEVRSASIYAIRYSQLVRFSKPVFEKLLARYPQMHVQITRNIIQRLKKATVSSEVKDCVTNIAIIPANQNVPLSDFLTRLITHLAPFVSTLHLNSDRLDTFLEIPGISQSPEESPNNMRLLNWLDEQETKYRLILYEADKTVSPWTKRCIRQADRVVIVGDMNATPRPGEIEIQLLDSKRDMITGARRTLILLHTESHHFPTRTNEWLSAREVENHYHVRWDRDEDFNRLARCLTGRAIGLVMGGGGARGYAHVGVIRALQEAGIPIDIIGGTSMGAIIASQYAMEVDCDKIIQSQKKLHEEDKPFKEYTLPIVSIFGGRRLSNAMKKYYENIQIEDLWLNFFCMSTNLSQAESVIHRRGSLWKAVKTSSSIPGVIPPELKDRDILVDGCILNNLPSNVMKEFCSGPIIAVNVIPKEDLTVDIDQAEIPTPWKIIRTRINPFKKSPELPNIVKVMMRTSMLASMQQADEIAKKTDFYLEPPVAQYGIMDFKCIDEIAQTGYQYAREKIKGWLKNDSLKKKLLM